MIKMTLLSLFVILLVFSCNEDQEVIESKSSQWKIKTGTICGWCSRNDTLTIAGTTTRYVNYVQCSTSIPAVQKHGQLSTSELETLLSKLDFNELKKIDLNTCNICFDGCDEWIYVQNGSDFHYIRFSKNDSKLQPIQEFIDQVEAIKTQYVSGY